MIKIINNNFYRQLVEAILVTLLGFVLIFLFFIVLDEVDNLGRPSIYSVNEYFTVLTLLRLAVLETPFLAYDLLPICVLIGSVYVLSRLAVQSEFTVLRSCGFSPISAIAIMLKLGLLFALITYITGDYLSPIADTQKTIIKAEYDGGYSAGHTGGWLREQRANQGYATLNVGELLPNGEFFKIRIYDFDDAGHLLMRIDAESGKLQDGLFVLKLVQQYEYLTNGETMGIPTVVSKSFPVLEWTTSLQSSMISATLLDKQRMNTLNLYQVIRHLRSNGQNSQRQEIEFWSKLIYPLSCVVMALMALPFAYLHFRQSGVSLYVFVGIMLGISFFLLSNMFTYIGNIQGWRPWLAAASPSLLYVSLSMAAVAWRVLRR